MNMHREYPWTRWIIWLVIVTMLTGMMPPPVQAQEPSVVTDTIPPTSSTPVPTSQEHPRVSATSLPHTIYLPLIQRTEAPVQVLISAGQGGTITSPDGRVQAIFSAIAVKEDVRVQFASLASPSIVSPTLAVGGPSFSFQASRASNNVSVGEFPHDVTIAPQSLNKPAYVASLVPGVTLLVQYTDEDVWGLDKRTLSLYARNNAEQPWLRIPTAVYQDKKLLVAQVEHLQEFVVLGEPLYATASLQDETEQQRLTLDPDDDVGHATWPGEGTVREIEYNVRLAQEVKQRLETDKCKVDILLTRESASQTVVDRAIRAQMSNNFGSNTFVTLAFNALTGGPWGIEADGGVRGWTRDDDALVNEFFGRIQEYTGRPHTQPVQHPGMYSDFQAQLSGTTYSHIEVLFLDHNYDWVVIRDGFPSISDAAYAALRTRLESLGMTCGDDPNNPPPLPAPPSAEQLKRWRDLGYQNYQKYGADPVSFSTGNHAIQVNLFRLPGRGGLDIDFTLTYNAQDGRDDVFGYSWSFPYNARAIHYSDDSVAIVLHDGRTYYYTWNGSSYTSSDGVYEQLKKTADGWRWKTPAETILTFQETVGGLGVLTEWQDRQGNTLHFTYDLSGQENWQSGGDVPRPPLTGITDDAGRTITIQSDSNSHITGISLPDSRSFSLSYSDGNLTEITDANGGTRRFQYDERHRITHEWDEEGILFLQNIYDDRDRVIEQIDASGVHNYLSYDPINRVTSYTDNMGDTTRYFYDEHNRVIAEVDPLGNRTEQAYDANNNLIAETDGRGYTTQYAYDDRGNLIERVDPVDRLSSVYYTTDTTHWTYNDRNFVTSMTDALGSTWQYEYDSAGNLARSTAPDGSITVATYNAWGQPTTITDPNGQTTSYEYDSYGNLTRTTDAAGNISTSTYDSAGREVSYTDSNGHTVSFSYDQNSNLLQIIDPKGNKSTFAYDGNDLLTHSTDRLLAETRYQYDENLKLIGEQDAEGHWTRHGYDKLYRKVTTEDAQGNVTHYEYDDAGHLVAVTDPGDGVTRYEYDASGNLTAVIDPAGHRSSMVYDSVNRIKYLIDATGHRTEFCYDAEDRLIRTIGPRNEVTDYTYDVLDRLIAVKDPLGNITRYTYDADGNRLTMTNPLNHQISYTYDAVDRLVTVEQPALADGQRPTTQFAYDAVGNVLTMTSPRGFTLSYAYDENDNVVKITDPMGGQTSYTYDAEDQPLTVTDPNGHTTTTSYNLVGLPVILTDAQGYATTLKYDAVYNLAEVINAQGKSTRYDYDQLGNLSKETDTLGSATIYERDVLGQVATVTDPNGYTTAYDYDALNHLIAVTDALSDTTSYTYDEVGNLASITDANSHTTLFDYNFLNQLVRETNPFSHTWRYSYDAAGNLTRRVDAEWHTIYYDYDSNNRMTGVRYGPDTDAQHPVTFAYDLDGNGIEMCDALGCATTTYDAIGRPTSTTDWLGRTITRSYDAAGNQTGMAYPNGGSVGYTYSANNWLTSVTDPHGDTSTYQHNPLGQVTQIARPNNTISSLSYDDAGRLTGMDNRKQGATQPQSAYAYALDKVGNRVEVTETRAAFDGSGTTINLKHRYQYDALNRLTGAATDTPASSTTYGFDAVGNRLSKDGTVLAPAAGVPELPVAPQPEETTYRYNAANQLIAVDGQEATIDLDYSDNGNRTRETTVQSDGTTLITDYAYDREDRLARVTEGHMVGANVMVVMQADYTYDGYGRRAVKEVSYPGAITPTQTMTYLYDGLDIIGATLESSGVVTETYYYLAPSPVTGLVRPVEMERLPNAATGFAGDRHWYQADGLDSVVALTDEGGNLVSPMLYDEYGQQLAGTSDLALFTYTAQDYDAETGLSHFYARYYDPSTGTWLTQDRYRGELTKQSTNRYQYTNDNPISSVDVLGFKDCGFNLTCKSKQSTLNLGINLKLRPAGYNLAIRLLEHFMWDNGEDQWIDPSYLWNDNASMQAYRKLWGVISQEAVDFVASCLDFAPGAAYVYGYSSGDPHEGVVPAGDLWYAIGRFDLSADYSIEYTQANSSNEAWLRFSMTVRFHITGAPHGNSRIEGDLYDFDATGDVFKDGLWAVPTYIANDAAAWLQDHGYATNFISYSQWYEYSYEEIYVAWAELEEPEKAIEELKSSIEYNKQEKVRDK